jgi:hypothetical protein
MCACARHAAYFILRKIKPVTFHTHATYQLQGAFVLHGTHKLKPVQSPTHAGLARILLRLNPLRAGPSANLSAGRMSTRLERHFLMTWKKQLKLYHNMDYTAILVAYP